MTSRTVCCGEPAEQVHHDTIQTVWTVAEICSECMVKADYSSDVNVYTALRVADRVIKQLFDEV